MLHRILNALNSYFGLPPMKELNVSIRPSENFVLIGNQPYSLCLVIHVHYGSLAYWLIHSESNSFDKGRSLHTNSERLHFVSIDFTEVLVT